MENQEFYQPVLIQAEPLQPDLSLAYSRIAPLVFEANAFLECGKPELAFESIKQACKVVRLVGLTEVCCSINGTDELDELETDDV